MARLLLTFENLFKVLAAEKALSGTAKCRPVPTPQHLSTSICAMALELLDPEEKHIALARLHESGNTPGGIHEID